MTTNHESANQYTVDPNYAAKVAVTTALGEIPEVGVLLEGLVEVFWPDKNSTDDVWNEIEERVEALVQRDLNTLVFTERKADLNGLMNLLAEYHTDPTDAAWHSAEAEFVAKLPSFQLSDYEVLLLPLWAQAANLHLGVLRDGVLFGPGWGWKDSVTAARLTSLQDNIKKYANWAERIFGLGMAGALGRGKVDYKNCQPFRAGNQYRSQMIPAVLDLAALWPYFDPTVHKPPASAADLYLSREIFTDPVGTADNSGLFVLPRQPPAKPISQITVWSEKDLIDAIQVSYPVGGGPDKVTQTARMGSPSTGTSHVVSVSPSNPIIGVSIWAGDVVQGLSFTFKDGSTSPHLGDTAGTRNDFSFCEVDQQGNKTWHVLSSIYVNGMSDFYRCVDSAVFGFQYERPASP